MPITIELPPEMEANLEAEWNNLELHALEGFVVEAFRSGKLSSSDVAGLLGLPDRWRAIEFLSERGVYPGYTLEDLEQDRCAIQRYHQGYRMKAPA